MKHVLRAAVSALLAVCALSGAAAAQETPEIEVTDLLPAVEVTDLMAEPAPTPAGPVQRYFLLLFDSPLGGVRQMDEVSATVEEWISRELLPTDATAVVSYYGQDLLVAQDFTRDRQALTAAVGAAVRGQTHAGRPAEEGCPSLLARLPQGEDLSQRVSTFYGTLQTLAQAVDSVPGSKGLLVFSKGFGRSRLAGFSEVLAGPELGMPVQALAESPVLEKYLPEAHLYEPTLEALLSRQIRLYPVDLATDYRETFPLAGVMSRLAAETEGRYVYPVTELSRVLVQIAKDGVAPGDRIVEQVPLPPAGVLRPAFTE
jgi:hypothetical protein